VMVAGHCDCGRFLVESFALLLHSTSPLFLWKLELRVEHFALTISGNAQCRELHDIWRKPL